MSAASVKWLLHMCQRLPFVPYGHTRHTMTGTSIHMQICAGECRSTSIVILYRLVWRLVLNHQLYTYSCILVLHLLHNCHSVQLNLNTIQHTSSLLHPLQLHHVEFVIAPSVLWYCWLGLLTCKKPYNLYCVGADVKPCSINQSINCDCSSWLVVGHSKCWGRPTQCLSLDADEYFILLDAHTMHWSLYECLSSQYPL